MHGIQGTEIETCKKIKMTLSQAKKILINELKLCSRPKTHNGKENVLYYEIYSIGGNKFTKKQIDKIMKAYCVLLGG